MNQYKTNYLHKLSRAIIDICIDNQVNYLIIGKNNLWKQFVNMGVFNNRKQYGIAHTQLIEYIKYKALLAGIVVLVTEESYTSKTSFINNSKLLIYTDKNKGKKDLTNQSNQDNKNSSTTTKGKITKLKNESDSLQLASTEVKATNLNTDSNITCKTSSLPSAKTSRKMNNIKLNNDIRFGGTRQSRGSYLNDNSNNNVLNKLVHADLNASYNMMRKAFNQCHYDSTRHNFNYKVMAVQSNKKMLKLLSLNH